MTMPLAYSPLVGYRYQILTRYLSQPWEHCDYAANKNEKDYLLENYRLAYGREFSFRVIPLPKKYWEGVDNG